MPEERYHYIFAYRILSTKNDYSLERVHGLHDLHGLVETHATRLVLRHANVHPEIVERTMRSILAKEASRERFYRDSKLGLPPTRDNDRRYGLRRYQGETSRLKARGSGARGGCIPRSGVSVR